MQFSEELVNQVVANVLSTISQMGSGRQSSGIAPSDSTPDSSVVLSDKVITADLLAEKIKGQSVVGIAAGSILTPSAKDYLREFNISIHRAAAVASSKEQGTPWRAIVLSNSSTVENALETIEQQTNTRWSQELSASLEESVNDAISSLCRADATGIILFAEAAEKAACLANRNQKIRAASIQDMNQLRNVLSQMSPNLICVNPLQKSFIELRNLIKTFVNAGVPANGNEL
ncbi:MAG: hypothetical protein K0U86_21270 [Planctomycetes bacterium]|nr:hypothetical protein [Planctomycetota bacterium]MCH9727436.1 hypothetical protein [Planctomycetota bacterium]MCH9775941.1 hypothetical protein [Planctomycetota bacterium]MCH9792968.1 hypothetical protein [Planctomycetota bacterium]